MILCNHLYPRDRPLSGHATLRDHPYLTWSGADLTLMIKLSLEHLQIICAHAESTYPDECCGIMFGHLVGESKTVVEVMPTDNAWSAETATDFSDDVETNHDASLDSKRRRYAIAPQVMFQAQRKARDRHFNIIGIYHSHPDYPNIPSEFDRLYAWQEYSYVIISVQKGKAADFKSWIFDDNHQFNSEMLVVSS